MKQRTQMGTTDMTARTDLARARKSLADRPDLVRLVLDMTDTTEQPIITTPETALPVLRSLLLRPDVMRREKFAVIAVDRRQRLVDAAVLTTGTDAFTIVDPKQVLSWCLARPGTAAFIVGHNHPSGDATPSDADEQVTTRLHAAGKVVGVPLLDHIVLGGTGYVSMAERGKVPTGCWEPVMVSR